MVVMGAPQTGLGELRSQASSCGLTLSHAVLEEESTHAVFLAWYEAAFGEVAVEVVHHAIATEDDGINRTAVELFSERYGMIQDLREQ